MSDRHFCSAYTIEGYEDFHPICGVCGRAWVFRGGKGWFLIDKGRLAS